MTMHLTFAYGSTNSWRTLQPWLHQFPSSLCSSNKETTQNVNKNSKAWRHCHQPEQCLQMSLILLLFEVSVHLHKLSSSPRLRASDQDQCTKPFQQFNHSDRVAEASRSKVETTFYHPKQLDTIWTSNPETIKLAALGKHQCYNRHCANFQSAGKLFSTF